MIQKVTGKYIYLDENGNVAYWKERLEPGRKTAKEFRFYHGRKELGRGGEPILYNLPNVIRSKAIIFTEGEKQADIINKWGLCGTTFDSGSNSKFPPAMVDVFKGKRVAVLRDNDAPGLVYAEMIANTLHNVCEVSRIVLLPGLPTKGDICDWVESVGNDRAAMLEIIKAAPTFQYVPPPPKAELFTKGVAKKGDIDGNMVAAAKAFSVERLIEFHQGYALCLWHKEEKPSLHYHAASNRVKCFSCGKGADAIELVMKRDGLSFPESVRLLCGSL
jgi:hypothetical protein